MATNVFDQFDAPATTVETEDQGPPIGPSGEPLNLPPNSGAANIYSNSTPEVKNIFDQFDVPDQGDKQFLSQPTPTPEQTGKVINLPAQAQPTATPQAEVSQGNLNLPTAGGLPTPQAPPQTGGASQAQPASAEPITEQAATSELPWYKNLALSAAAQAAYGGIQTAAGFERAGAAPVTDLSGITAPFQRGAKSEEAISAFDNAIADKKSALESLQGIVQKKGFTTAEYSGQISDLQREITDLEAQKEQTLQLPEYQPQAQTELGQQRQQLGQSATGLGQTAESMFPYFGVSKTDTSVSGQLGRGVGTVLGLAPAMATGPLALPVMAIQGGSEAYAESYNNKVQELKQQGVTDQATLDAEGHKAGSQGAVKTIPSLAAYTVGGALTSGATSALLKGATPAVKALVGGTAAAGVNLATSGGLRVAEGGNFMPNIEQAVPDIFFGAFHGGMEYFKARAEAEAIARRDAALGGPSPKLKPSSNPLVNKREAEILSNADEQSPAPLSPEQQKMRDDLEKMGEKWEALRSQLVDIANQLQNLPEDHPDRAGLRDRARKISQQMADLRAGKPVDVETTAPNGDERFKPKPETQKAEAPKEEKLTSEKEKQKTTEDELREAYPNTAFFDEANEAIQRLNQEDARTNNRQRFAPPSLQDLRQLITNPAYKLADKLAGIFGKKVVLYKGEEGTYINGATSNDPALKNYIFLKIDGQRPHLFTAGHELWHHIELYSPVLATDLRNQIMPLIKDWAGLKGKYKAAGYDKSRFFDEHIADFLGDAMQDPKFWNDLAKKNPKSFKELATKTVNWLNKLLYQLKDWKMGGDYTRDIQKARDMLVDGLSKFAEGKDEPVSDVSERGPMFQQDAEEKRNKDFYSQLQKTITDKMPNKASVDQIKAIIDPAKGSGVKPDELKWSNLEGFLEGKKSVTKEEVLDYLKNEGAVKFEEVRLGEDFSNKLSERMQQYLEDSNSAQAPSNPEGWQKLSLILENQAQRLQARGNDEIANEYFTLAEEASRISEGLNPETGSTQGIPKYSQYTLPNGENYREVVLTMPGSESLNLKHGMEARQMDDGTWNIWEKNGWVYREGSATKNALLGKASQDEMLAKPNQETYRSSHFSDIPNYVAHMRLDERPDSEGRNGLFIEEIQSDRHQAGREKGYAGEGEQKYFAKESNDPRFKGLWYIVDKDGKAQSSPIYTREVAEAAAKKESNRGSIPDAPFRKDWSVQMFKRALRDAIASGKEWVGWTKGDTQAERYDLSKQVDSIEVIKSGDNKYHVTAYKNGKDVVNDPNVSQDKLPDMIGKELANKAIDQINSSKDPNLELASFSGVDLKVGGEGMKGFYDQILPKEIAKYVKKWGAKVEEGEVGSEYYKIYDPTGKLIETHDTKSQAMKALRGYDEGYTAVVAGEPKTTIWKVEITPEMRDSVTKEGQPMFQQDKPEEETQRPELNAGAKDTGAYHYGDLGIADDTKYSRMSASRGTGHFGTGTYFLGEKSAGGKYGGRADRPIVNVNLEELNLAKPKDPMRLHDALKLVNKMVYREEKPEFSQERFDGSRALFGLNYELGFSKHSREEIQKAIEDTFNEFASGENDGFRSPSTVLMQKLGYDGVDVRGTKADNTDYGSVVYPNQENPMFQQDRPTEQEASKKREEIETKFQASPIRKTKNTIVNNFRRRPAKEAISYMRDAGDNAANIYAKENTNEVANDLKREFKKQNDKAAEALSFVIEAQGDQAELAKMRQTIANSPDASKKWQKKAIAAIDFADNNFARLEPIADKYNKIGLHQVAQENANGIDTPVREGYVPHYQDLEEQELFGGAGTGSATSFRKMRTYDTFADSIANGVDPKSLNAVDLLQKRLSSGQKSINYRSWIDSLKQTIDPASGDPIATKVSIVKRPDGSSYLQVPRGYKQETLAGQRVAIKDGYGGIISSLNDPSAWSRNMAGRAIQKGAGLGKSITLGLDTYHLGRIAIWDSLIKSLGIKTFKLPIPSYRKGATLLDQTLPELQKMIANGEIPKRWAKGLIENKRLLNLAVKTGYNIGGISDSLHQDLVHSIPVLGDFNSWLFNSFQRGAMAESWLLEFQRYRNAYPNLSEAEVARMVSKDLNTRFGNLGRQGILKSKTMQDTARFLFLAPQWNEGLIRTELGAMGQTGKALLDAATGKRFFAGVLARSVGGMVVAQFVANQLINYATRGTPTWENPEEGVGAKISAYIPDAWGGPGFFLNPMSLATETTHLLLKGYERTGDALDTVINYFRSRSSVPMRPVWDAVTRKNVLGTPYAPGQAWKGMLEDMVPYPIAAGTVYAAAKEAASGEPSQQFAGQYQKQLFQTFGVKLEGAASDESRIYTLANHFKMDNNIQDRMAGYSSPYSDLNRSLSIGNMTNAKNALTKILETKTPAQVQKYYKDTYPNMRLLESKIQQKDFLDSLNDEQREIYDRAREHRKENAEKALDLLQEMQ